MLFQKHDDAYLMHVMQDFEGPYDHKLKAVYTHSYDESGTRLFAAGGPLQGALFGNYVALFQ